MHEAFNPAIVVLPSIERTIAQRVFPTTVYLAATRLKGNQCHLKRVFQPALSVIQARRKDQRGSALVLLDSSFRVVGEVNFMSLDSKTALSATDMRLDTLPDAVLPGIVATFCTFGSSFATRGEWHARRVTLRTVAGGTLV